LLETDPMPLVASSRMYNLTPDIRSLWDGFFGWLAHRSGVALSIIAHAAPAPLSELWERPDLGAVFMCGFPFASAARERRPVPLAAPVAKADWSRGGPLYESHVAVSAASPFHSLEDLRGRRIGWTARDSQSGYHAVRALIASAFGEEARLFFGATAGPFFTPMGIIEAIADGRIAAGPLDAYAFDLLSRHAPDVVERLRIVATTASTPAPLLIASRQADVAHVEALRTALTGASGDPAARPHLDALGLSSFAAVEENAYDVLVDRARSVSAGGLSDW
jgi:ABC-type phosphate/phosphonate transport system substrate-binding protein